MRAGLLKEDITVERQTIVENGFGEFEAGEWVPVIRTKANVTDVSNQRELVNGEVFYPADLDVRVRIYHRITELDRIVWNGHKYRIVTVPRRDKDRQLLEFKCQLWNE